MIANAAERVAALVDEALLELSERSVPLSGTIQKAIRVARLRHDYEALFWLQMELMRTPDPEVRKRLSAEIRPHFTAERFRGLNEQCVRELMEERTIRDQVRAVEDLSPTASGKLAIQSVTELESTIETTKRIAAYAMARNMDAEAVQAEHNLRMFRGILDRIAHRVHDYLSITESRLLYAELNADIFERNRRYVDERLSAVAPEAVRQFVAAYDRASDGTSEARAHALTSCRRILKTVADHVYPPASAPIVGPDGRQRVLDDSKYLARLWQYVHEHSGSTRAGQLLEATVVDLGNRIDRVNDLANKGAHSTTTEFEANQCVIQTYLVIGDVLRLGERGSATDRTGADR